MNSNELRALRQRVSEKTPLVLNITNYVAMNINANALLAVGASPLMSFYPDEMEDMMNIADSLCVNIGCLDLQQCEAMKRATAAAETKGKPWVLDPVGVGASAARNNIVAELLQEHKPTVIRCNASEVMAIAGMTIVSHGVDADPSLKGDSVIRAAKAVASHYGTIVSVSGEIDYITDGEKLESVSLGSSLMPKVTAMGCTASAITAAFVATFDDKLHAAYAAMMTMGYCGQNAAAKAKGPGSFVPLFVDELYNL